MTEPAVGIAEDASVDQMAAEFQKLELGSGDLLVMRFKYQLEAEIIKALTKKLYEALPTGVRCLVVDPSIELSVIKAVAADEE